jgi:hypothetical protein
MEFQVILFYAMTMYHLHNYVTPNERSWTTRSLADVSLDYMRPWPMCPDPGAHTGGEYSQHSTRAETWVTLGALQATRGT